MKTVIKYLKPFIVFIVICLCCQVVRAYGELKLPNIMSDLVNVGIQYGGFEEKAPSDITYEGIDTLGKFMTDEDAETFKNSYEDAYSGHWILSEDAASKELDEIYITSCMAALAYYRDISDEDDSFSLNWFYGHTPEIDAMVADGSIGRYIDEAQKTYTLTGNGAEICVTFSKGFAEDLGLDLHKIQMDYMIKRSLLMIVYLFVVLLFNVTVGYCAVKTATGFATNMRSALFRKYIKFSNKEFDKMPVASLITRSTNDISQTLSLIIMVLRLFVFAFIMSIGSFIMAATTSIKLSWIPGVTLVALLAIMGILSAIVMPKFKKLQSLVDRVNQLSREFLKGTLVIRAFGNEKFAEDNFDKTSNDLKNTNRFTQRTMAFMGPAMTILMNVATLLLIWLGKDLIASSEMGVGDLLAYMQYAMHVVMSFMIVATMFVMVPRALISIRRIEEVLTTEPSIKDPESPVQIGRATGKIEFKNVTFRYSDSNFDALSDISFTAEPGKTTAIIGSTGAGKTTLVNLIMRLYDTNSGSVEIDGIDIRDITLHDLRENIGFVPQQSILFQGTFRSNMLVGKADATDEEILRILEIAQAKDFVMESEHGLDTEVSQGGTSVSGGQRQRLAIARALIKGAPVCIFDDSYSALDVKTDAALRKAIAENYKDLTMIVVAQRISTIMNADKIIVLDEGKIVGMGKHSELLENCPTYREITESQFSKGEWD